MDDRELIMDILRYGASCEVLAPKALRETILKHITQMMLTYQPHPTPLDTAIEQFDQGLISLGHAAKTSGMTRSEFSAHLARLGIPIIRTSAQDLENELKDME